MASDINSFIRERAGRWRRLENIIRQASKGRRSSLSEAEAREFGLLYRAACGDLTQARTEIRNAEVVGYLNDLVARAYSILYANTGRTGFFSIAEFFARDFPRLFRKRIGCFMASLGCFAAGMAFGFFAGILDPDSIACLLPNDMASFETAEEYLSMKGTFAGGAEAAAFTSMLFSNNLRVSFMAFASSVTLAGPALFMFYNGAVLGSFGALFHMWDRSFAFWVLIVPHGMLELTACLIAGQAGLLLASAALFPGEAPRIEALREKGAEAVRLLLGSAPMTIAAAVLEAYVSPLPPHIMPDWAKVATAAATVAAALCYLLGAGKKERPV